MREWRLHACALVVLVACGTEAETATPSSDAGLPPSDATTIADAGTDSPDTVEDTGAPCDGRVTVDRPDDATGYQLKAMYVLPSDGTDEQLDTCGAIARSVKAITDWFAKESGGQRPRWDTSGGVLDVAFARLTKTDAEIAARGAYVRDELEDALPGLGFADPKKIYAVYYGGSSTYACGGGAYPPTLYGHVAALYLKGLPAGPVPCATNTVGASATKPGYFEFAILHESFHTMGAVAICAPHQTMTGHVSDGNDDLMYAGSSPWYPSKLDNGRDDYYGHSNTGCVDLARSVFMDPLPANALAPPGW